MASTPRRSWAPSSAFTHPAWLFALVVLVVNDHFLKQSGLAPGWLTGKLSDVAGLLVAPAVLAWLVRARSGRAWILTHAAVGIGFALLENMHVASWVSSSGLVRTWADPTDLLALPMLLVSLRAFGPRAPRREPRPALGIGVLALIACAATSQSAPSPRYPYPPRGILRTDVYVRHEGPDSYTLRVQRVRDEVALDCDALMGSSPPVLGDGHFSDSQDWILDPGDAVPLWNQGFELARARERECYAVRMHAHGRWWLVRWRAGQPDLHEVPIRNQPGSDAEPGAIVVRAGGAPPRAPAEVLVTPL